jgi:hypothetical protein
MSDKYIKDITILLGVVILIVLSFRVYYLYNQVNAVPAESIYNNIALNETLLERIHQIDNSITERKEFRFTVRRDPLKQDLIVQNRMDLLAEYEAMLRRLMRLSTVIEDNMGNSVAIIEYQGRQNVVKVGDTLGNRRFTNIDLANKRAYFTEGGVSAHLVVTRVPPPPAELDSSNRNNINEYIW